MKALKTILPFVICCALLFNLSSCVVVTRKDNGKHKGWNKNSNNPHHPKSTNPGSAKKKY